MRKLLRDISIGLALFLCIVIMQNIDDGDPYLNQNSLLIVNK